MKLSDYHIPFNIPDVTGLELDYVASALQHHTSGIGPYTVKCEKLLEELLGAPRVLLTSSGTAALEIAATLLGTQPGWIAVPSFTHPSTANAFLRFGDPLFIDIRQDTLCMNTDYVAEFHSSLHVPVHYAGVACRMDRIPPASAVIEDNAHGLFASLNGKPLGTFGNLAALSFHETKNIICGEGGALIINDANLISRAEIIRDKGTDRSRFLRGEVDRYTWQDTGSSYVLSDVLASFLFAQLERREWIMTRRKDIWHYYDQTLKLWSDEYGVRQPFIPADCTQSYHMYYLLMPTPESRAVLIDTLEEKGILAVTHYQPLHLSPMGQRFGGRKGQCPVSEWASERIVRLPFYNTLSKSDQDEVVDAVSGVRI